MSNVCGRATALTALTPIKPGWLTVSKVGMVLPRRVPLMTAALRKLSFIHFARWSIIQRIPHNGPPHRPEHPRYAYLYFESNFNGTWDDYIDSFSYVMPGRMRFIWGGSFGFPGAKPVETFKQYITASEFEADHFYAAYPDATATMVQSALEVDRRFDNLRTSAAAEMSPEAFGDAWRRFLQAAQRHL